MSEPTQLHTTLVHLTSPDSVISHDGALHVKPQHPSQLVAIIQRCRQVGAVLDRDVYIDLSQLNQIQSVNTTARLVHINYGVTVGQLANELKQHNLALWPAHIQPDTLSAALYAQPIGSLLTTQVNLPAQLLQRQCIGGHVCFYDGTSAPAIIAPRRATGPELYRLFVGTQARFGLLASATLQVAPHTPQTSNTTVIVSFQYPDAALAIGQQWMLQLHPNISVAFGRHTNTSVSKATFWVSGTLSTQNEKFTQWMKSIAVSAGGVENKNTPSDWTPHQMWQLEHHWHVIDHAVAINTLTTGASFAGLWLSPHEISTFSHISTPQKTRTAQTVASMDQQLIACLDPSRITAQLI